MAPGALQAQDPEVRAQRLREQVEQRFWQQMNQELRLSSDQEPKTRTILSGYAEQRRRLEAEERALRRALNDQLRPGIAADPDSVGKLVDAITNLRVSYVQLFRDENRDLSGVLTPLQRGQYFQLRDRLLQRIQEMRQQRPGGPPGGPPPPEDALPS
jgi:Spy/CpxP family protein refolding chaperone